MGNTFEFSSRTKIAFGIDRSLELGKDVKKLSRSNKAVLITDPGIIKAGLADHVIGALEKEDIEIQVFHNVQSDPMAGSIDEAAEIIRSCGAKCVLGLGGGSAMDVAKMAALVAGGERAAMHYALMANPFAPKSICTIMIPTTSGTGAEVTNTVVFSDENKRKVWAWDAEMAPDMAIIDPQLTAALPAQLTAATTFDALVHAIEACTGKRTTPIIEAFSLQAIRLISQNIKKVLHRPDDLEARGKLALAATMAGMAIEQGGTGIAHCIGHALGTLARIHHGKAVTIALMATYMWNAEAAVTMYAEIARALGVKDEGLTEKELALAGASQFSQMVAESGLNLSLQDENLSAADIDCFLEVMESEENAPMRLNNCRLATSADLKQFAADILQTSSKSKDLNQSIL
ncbi:alcohol dehydrogenase class IV [Caldalkalibacillus uzonensis]|uniref:Alcohol dehydrogenase class IV n=1 Tax=Caldalkalibacillus uzonensis TaxID=353224 RepID=A0ABU0CXP4_9BACI|nr:iron-containing alcohol dehydrogenase [Caldalkalibacillus uzonensis]MDQ0340562.1 alcohol dehydrogenase class IV [Caldalkalibacillus uzonensis]